VTKNPAPAPAPQSSAARQDVDPPLLSPGYGSTTLRAPTRPPVPLQLGPTELTGPLLGEGRVTAEDADLTRGPAGEAVGQRIIVTGRVLDEDDRPVRNGLLELWQANAAGRYRHDADRWPASLDPNFTGLGRVLTDDDGSYRFLTVRPGAYPWRNHENAWRPAHIHFSLFGRAFVQRLVTQMYFPDDPLLPLDPIYNAVPAQARSRLVSSYAHDVTQPEWALGFRFDIVLRGAHGTPFEADHDHEGEER
jgi:protocatechuate 3,4-dioxygenase beta subunit